MPRVLLIDDDKELLELLRDYLQSDGFGVSCASDGHSGIKAVLGDLPDIVVLDVMMPGINGMQALTQIRALSSVPVLMLTAKGDDADRIMGLEFGADDYVPKPCTPRELAARLRAILNRTQSAPTEKQDVRVPITVGALILWPAKRQAQHAGQELVLTSTEFSLLEVLARHPGEAVSKQQLSEEGLGRPSSRFDRSIDVHVSSIRQKVGLLSDGSSPIKTVIRKGYQLIIE
jgi:two-component system OmpR family response regulator/two-component system response regulator CpxR